MTNTLYMICNIDNFTLFTRVDTVSSKIHITQMVLKKVSMKRKRKGFLILLQ